MKSTGSMAVFSALLFTMNASADSLPDSQAIRKGGPQLAVRYLEAITPFAAPSRSTDIDSFTGAKLQAQWFIGDYTGHPLSHGGQEMDEHEWDVVYCNVQIFSDKKPKYFYTNPLRVRNFSTSNFETGWSSTSPWPWGSWGKYRHVLDLYANIPKSGVLQITCERIDDYAEHFWTLGDLRGAFGHHLIQVDGS